MQVKICGLKEAVHVEAAVQAGVDAIGFVFAPSQRRITPEQAHVLAEIIPPTVKKVGVFVNEKPSVIREIYTQVPLDYVQYHGQETPEMIEAIGLPAIKAFAVRTEEDVRQAAAYNVAYYLFDAPGTDYQGGSGHVFDWSLLEKVGIPKTQLWLAGGLHSGNVQQAIEMVQPILIDVSSGVEENQQKSVEKIQQFLTQVKGANKYE